MYLVGKIVGTHGIKGEVKVKADTSFSRFETNNILFIKKDNEFQKIEINSHRIHKNHHLITFNNYRNINDVLEYVGCEIYTNHDDQLADDEYYYEDLIGKEVVDDALQHLGYVSDIREVPQGIILEVKNNDKAFLVPFVSEFILEVNDKIKIKVIEGLL